jgi:hypothetical protein
MMAFHRAHRRLLRVTALAALVALLLLAALALARPGGGGSFSGGGGGGGGGGSIGDCIGCIVCVVDVVGLCIEHPIAIIPIVGGFGLLLLIGALSKGRTGPGWSTRDGAELPSAIAARGPLVGVTRKGLDRLRLNDPDFSIILFEDFLYMLYAELQRARGAGRIEALSAYVSLAAQAHLGDGGVGEVKGIVIGSMRYLGVSGFETLGAPVRLSVEFEANTTEVHDGGEQRFYLKEVLALSRAPGARSRPPARARRLDCPNCGAPLTSIRGGTCESCHQEVSGGRFDWTVDDLRTLSREPRGPLLTTDVQEVGTERPTVFDPDAQAGIDALKARDPALTWQALRARIEIIFRELQLGWSSRDWMRVRPFVSDNLFQSQLYWIDLYTAARARNVTENARILRLEIANVLSDNHYDAITVRLFATGLDYTISDDGKLLSGSRTSERAYSEYWTVIRGRGTSGAAKEALHCPNCGASLKINMAGSCEYCEAKITSGEFDWVLSRIEQDEVYCG